MPRLGCLLNASLSRVDHHPAETSRAGAVLPAGTSRPCPPPSADGSPDRPPLNPQTRLLALLPYLTHAGMREPWLEPQRSSLYFSARTTHSFPFSPGSSLPFKLPWDWTGGIIPLLPSPIHPPPSLRCTDTLFQFEVAFPFSLPGRFAPEIPPSRSSCWAFLPTPPATVDDADRVLAP